MTGNNFNTFSFHLAGRNQRAPYSYDGCFDDLLEELEKGNKTLVVYTPKVDEPLKPIILLTSQIISVEEL